jgi:Fe-S cluster assembly scaffold protein SufB
VGPGVVLHYVGLFDSTGTYTREFLLETGAHYDGGVVIYGTDVSYQATTRILGDSVKSHLQILGLARDGARLDIRGSSIVDVPYRHIQTRVDQNNIFLGEGGSIRGMPILEIATDDIV